MTAVKSIRSPNLEIFVVDEVLVVDACIIAVFVLAEAYRPSHVNLACVGGSFSHVLIKRTQEVWQPLSEAAITERDAEEALRNMLDLCHVLWEIETRRDG